MGELEGAAGTGLKRLVEKHQVLRTGFQQLPGMTVPLQVIMEEAKGVHQEQELESGAGQAISGAGGGDHGVGTIAGAAGQEAAASAAAGWREGPLRTVLLKLRANRHLLVVTLAGLCGDAQTLDNLVESLGHCYAAEGKRAGAGGVRQRWERWCNTCRSRSGGSMNCWRPGTRPRWQEESTGGGNRKQFPEPLVVCAAGTAAGGA